MKFRELLEQQNAQNAQNENTVMKNDFVLQKLADSDINAKIEKDFVIVDKSDVKKAEKILKSIGCKKSVKSGLNETIEGINEFGIGYLVTYSLYMVAQAHVWHLLCTSGQKHTALGEFYSGIEEEVDGLAEKFIAQGGRLNDTSIQIVSKYDEYEVIQKLEDYRSYISGCISNIGSISSMASIVDSITDLQEVLDKTLYKFKLQ